jgi:hypothetical protein
MLRRNLAALSGTDPALADQLERTPASEAVRFLPVGATAVPALLRDGRPPVPPWTPCARPRLAALQPAAEAGGARSGRQLHLALLQGPSVSRLLVIERDAGLAPVLERLELWDVLADPRLKLLPGLEPRLVKQAVLMITCPCCGGENLAAAGGGGQDRQCRRVTGFVQGRGLAAMTTRCRPGQAAGGSSTHRQSGTGLAIGSPPQPINGP